MQRILKTDDFCCPRIGPGYIKNGDKCNRGITGNCFVGVVPNVGSQTHTYAHTTAPGTDSITSTTDGGGSRWGIKSHSTLFHYNLSLALWTAL